MEINRFSHGLRLGALALALGGAITAAPPASALTITGNFLGGAAPGGTTGAGTLQGLFNFAASQWELLIPDAHNLTINYQWGALGGTTIGLHQLQTQGGVPNRETQALLTFDNDGSVNWFLDGTPGGNSEYTNNTMSSLDLGGGVMTTGNQWTGATGAASGQFDLLSVVLHEIGHSLGLSAANTSFQTEAADVDVDVTSGVFSGAVIPLTASNNAHVNISTALMFPSTSVSTRTLISDADLMANCQISQFTDCLNGAAAVPEPSSLLLLGTGLAGLAGWRWRKDLVATC